MAMADGLRWQQRSEVADGLKEELPAMQGALTENRRSACAEKIGEALEEASAGPGELVGWAAVAVRRLEDGATETYVCGDGASTDLEIKGYLHSAVWEAAHHSGGMAL